MLDESKRGKLEIVNLPWGHSSHAQLAHIALCIMHLSMASPLVIDVWGRLGGLTILIVISPPPGDTHVYNYGRLSLNRTLALDYPDSEADENYWFKVQETTITLSLIF